MTGGVCISGAELVSALGPDLESAFHAWAAGAAGLHPPAAGDFPSGAGHPVLCGRIADRECLRGRRYGAASNLAVHVARSAVRRAGWSPEEVRDAWIFAASSRGNAGELLGAHNRRRPVRRLRASNTLHSEIAAAVSIELGIRGPWQMFSNGCSSGLDALGFAWRAVASGWTPRALVVAAELPLVPELLRDFADSGLLASDRLNDPFSLRSTGFHPAEAGVALTLDTPLGHRASLCRVTGYTANSDAYDALASPPSGHGLASLFAQELDRTTPVLLCTHTTGTRSCSVAEEAALASVFAERGLPTPALLPLKTLTGHALGASGLVDTALLAAAIARGHFPALEASLSTPAGMPLLKTPLPAGEGRVVWKCASAMGGHNALVTLSV